MGCATSHHAVNFDASGKVRRTTLPLDENLTISHLESPGVLPSAVGVYYGHPEVHKGDEGFRFGLQTKGASNMQSIYIAVSNKNGEKVSVKEHNLKKYSEALVAKEILLLSGLRHDSIPKLRSIFITDKAVYQAMDYVDTTTVKHMINFRQKSSSLPINDVRSIMRSLLSALAYCHERRVVVRHLTPGNITIMRSFSKELDAPTYFTAKISDFSFAAIAGSTDVVMDHPLFDKSDVAYLSPEALARDSYLAIPASDNWSAGVLMFLMLSGCLPFEATNDEMSLEQCISTMQYSFNGEVWNNPQWQDAKNILELFFAEQSFRITAKNALTNKWMHSL